MLADMLDFPYSTRVKGIGQIFQTSPLVSSVDRETIPLILVLATKGRWAEFSSAVEPVTTQFLSYTLKTVSQ